MVLFNLSYQYNSNFFTYAHKHTHTQKQTNNVHKSIRMCVSDCQSSDRTMEELMLRKNLNNDKQNHPCTLELLVKILDTER